MRWFIGILVVANLAILVWGWLGEDQQPKMELAAPDVGTIRIVGEAPPAVEPEPVPIPAPPRSTGAMTAPAAPPAAPAVVSPLTEPTVAAVEPEPAEPPEVAQPEPSPPAVITAPEPVYVPEPEPQPLAPQRYCQRIGPFADEKASTAARTRLDDLGDVALQRETEREVSGYWVLIPPQSSRDAAKAVAERLKAKGIKDLWIVGKGAERHAISLGVFSSQANAERFAKRVGDKGFDVTIQEKTKEREVVWLAYQGPKAINPNDLPAGLPADVAVSTRDCP